MFDLAGVTLLIGVLAVVSGGAALLAPARVRAGLVAFPRSVWPGRLLVAADLAWASYELAQMHLGTFDAWKPHLYWLTPIGIGLCVVYLNDLLSPRALGGFLLLAAGPVLDIARWHESNWRLVIVVLAYLWILLGLLWLLSPWWFRRIAQVVAGNDLVVRIGGALKVLVGGALLVLAWKVF
jgi:uncharacterized membrane protein